ncbi:hypothetical protein MCOR25_004193 [Pyricularia grisea]|uniref:AB hydrolase-1 domain-containing protein n=1 Tax=Pyricularia grisea TaxID=148305 RepID=A0A6P8AV62_PYRGI|nr:uncharacterized protein PgNI_08332 [Pyricularia grisea]KAI6370455.1 hypothetical protein MCOR25_004193 [Pyricularia grisea]TLD06102.1 hypothetical protein PgNI_08332 [Pyricularia grisea]
MPTPQTQTIPTPWCPISATITEPDPTTTPRHPAPTDLTLLLLHGNSSSSLAFSHILSRDPPAGVCRVIALDYPGHGRSGNAATDAEADRVYTQPGYAVVAAHALAALGVRGRVAVLGWSLGGHVAIELIPLLAPSSLADRAAALGAGPLPGTTIVSPPPPPPPPPPASRAISLAGIMLVGTPPLGNAAQLKAGFTLGAGECASARESRKGDVGRGGRAAVGEISFFALAAEELTDDLVESLTVAGHGPPREQWMADGVRRTDGRARRAMAENAFAGELSDQVGIVGASDVLCAVVNGAEEQFVNLDYVDGVSFRNLWRGECHRIPALGHAPFWEAPDLFWDDYLTPFLADCNAAQAYSL